MFSTKKNSKLIDGEEDPPQSPLLLPSLSYTTLDNIEHVPLLVKTLCAQISNFFYRRKYECRSTTAYHTEWMAEKARGDGENLAQEVVLSQQ